MKQLLQCEGINYYFFIIYFYAFAIFLYMSLTYYDVKLQKRA